MKSLIQRLSKRILVISMIIVVLSFFSVRSISEAKLTLGEGEFYYSGTQEGTYEVRVSLLQQLINSLGEIANYILGTLTLPIRGMAVGWMEIMEIILTAFLGMPSDLGQFFSDAIAGMDSYSQNVVTLENIIFNRVPILNANIFSTNYNRIEKIKTNSKKIDEKNITQKEKKEMVDIIRDAVAQWYYILRLISIAFMLILLIFIGIKLAISSLYDEKALYKRMLTDWVAGMILVFSIHFIMIAILNINDTIVDSLYDLNNTKEKSEIQEEYEYGDELKIKDTEEIEETLYETTRTRAYSLKMTEGFSGLVIYGVLVYYAWKFSLIYLRRVINIFILTIVAPVIAASYAVNKALTGKSRVFSSWFKEYIMNVIIQVFHAIMYVSFVSMALELSVISLSGIVLALVLLNFMSQAGKLFRQLFRMSGGEGSLAGDMVDKASFRHMRDELKATRNAMVGGVLTKGAIKATYGALAQPVKSYAEKKLPEWVANSANKNKEKNDKKAEDKFQREKSAAEDFASSESGKELEKLYLKDEELKARREMLLSRKEELEKRNEELKNRNDELTNEAGESWRDGDIEEVYRKREEQERNRLEIQRNEEELKQIEETVQKDEQESIINQKEINKKEKKLQKEFLEKRQNEYEASMGDIVKDNLRDALMQLVEQEKDEKGNRGKYVAKKFETKREGMESEFWNKYAFWRKKTEGVSVTLKESMKFTKLIGASDADAKALKKIIELEKNKITALFAGMAASSAMGVNPLVGMALLTHIASTNSEVKVRRRIFDVRMTHGAYTFKDFGSGPKAFFKKVAKREYVFEYDKTDAAYHKKVRQEINKATKYGQTILKEQKRHDAKVSDLLQTSIDKMMQMRNEKQQEVEEKDVEQLAFDQKVREKDVVNVGDGVCMQLTTNIKMKEFLSKVDDIDSNRDLDKEQKLTLIQETMKEYKSDIIKESILNVCEQKGIAKIEDVKLTDAEVEQVNYNIKNMLQAKGVVERGEIDLEKSEIDKTAISETHSEMTRDAETTNQEIEEKIVSSSVLEYISITGEKDVENLKTEEAKKGIEEIVKLKLMSDSSKQSDNVIEQILNNSNEETSRGSSNTQESAGRDNSTGEDENSATSEGNERTPLFGRRRKEKSVKEEFELSENVIESIDKNVNKVKKIEKKDLLEEVKDKSKEFYVDREVNAEMNATKDTIEQAIYTEDTSELDQKKLDLLMILSELQQENLNALQLGQRPEKDTKEQTMTMLEYHHEKKKEEHIDNYSPNINIEQNDIDTKIKINKLDSEIHGPSVDIIDLINNIGKQEKKIGGE